MLQCVKAHGHTGLDMVSQSENGFCLSVILKGTRCTVGQDLRGVNRPTTGLSFYYISVVTAIKTMKLTWPFWFGDRIRKSGSLSLK